jgi:ABC-2 type transport system ATP-binding protein
VILDEPFSGLDPINAQALKDTVVDLRQRGKTVIFSTHLMDNAERLCDAVCIIARGEKVLDGGVQEVKQAHGGRHVALGLDRAAMNGAAPAVSAVLDDRTLVAHVDDQNRYLELELAPARARSSCCSGWWPPAPRSRASSSCSPRCTRSSWTRSAPPASRRG